MSNKIKLGAFVLAGVTALLLGLFFIGSQKNIFSSTISVSADFNNVGGLMPGNNVRFNGINVGTVSKVFPISDSLVKVNFTIDEKLKQYITQNDVASIGTDGMLGNKLVNIEPSKQNAPGVQNGHVLKSLDPIQMDNIMRSFTSSGDNFKAITENLKDVSVKINGDNVLWQLLNDTALVNNLKSTAGNFKLMSNQGLAITGDLKNVSNDFKDITEGVKRGKGTLGALISDTTFAGRINGAVAKFERIGDTAHVITTDMSLIIKNIKRGQGSVGVLLSDTMMAYNLNHSIIKIDSSAAKFSENMEALRYSWPFKKYFKDKNKKKQ